MMTPIIEIAYKIELAFDILERIRQEGVISDWADLITVPQRGQEHAIGFWLKDEIEEGKERPAHQLINLNTIIRMIEKSFHSVQHKDEEISNAALGLSLAILIANVSNSQLSSEDINYMLQLTIFGEVRYV